MRLLKRSIPTSTQEWLCSRVSYSQFGEDIVIHMLLADRGMGEQGFYVDVGAFDPVVYSNTLAFHRRGWRGINIDADAESIERFRNKRPRDINVHAAVSDREEDVEFCVYPHGLENRLVQPGSDGRSGGGQLPAKRLRIKARRLADILREHVPPGTHIGFMSVDCEGHDLAVLKSNDWSQYKPLVLACEDWEAADVPGVSSFCADKGYREVVRLGFTRIFVLTADRRSANE